MDHGLSMFQGLFQPLDEGETKPKFTKEQAGYAENRMLYICRICRFYLGEEERKCQLVDEAGDPQPGEIRPEDGCDVWNAGPLRQMVRERRFGRGPPPSTS